MNETGQKSEVDRREFVERDGKIEELNLKVHLFADDLENMARIQAQVTATEEKLSASRVAAWQLTKPLDTKTRAHVSF